MENDQEQTSMANNAQAQKSSRLSQINLILTMTVKLVVIGVLVALFSIGKSVYDQYAHYGPSCDENASSFQYWIDQGKEVKGKVVSVHRSRLQAENGTSQCYGKFLTDEGEYREWEGSISELSDKEVVGRATVSQ